MRLNVMTDNVFIFILWKEAAALKQKLIIIIVILVVIISANIWFIWYRKSLERKIEDKKNKNSDQNSFTSKG